MNTTNELNPVNKIWSSENLKKVFSIKTNLQGNQVKMNSQIIEKGDIFIAFDNGENHDGHKYVIDAINKGASICIVNENSKIDLTQYEDKLIKVKDTNVALNNMAKYKQNNYNGKIIAITGSVGKTTTKNITYELVKSCVQNEKKVFCSYKNFNNMLGVKLNLCCLPHNTEYAVFEIGMNHPGEIEKITQLIKPDIAVITNIAPTHIGNFANIQGIAKAKSEIFSNMIERDIAILNRDSDLFEYLTTEAANKKLKLYTYGLHPDSDIMFKTKHMDSDKLFTVQCQLKKGNSFSFKTRFLTDEFIKNIICGFSILKSLKLEIKQKTIDCIANFNLNRGRGQIINIKQKNITIIDSSYNASNYSLKNSLQYIKKLSEIHQPTRCIFIMGDMKEQGDYTKQLHQSVVPLILDSKIDKYICVGESVKIVYDDLPENTRGGHFNTVEDLIKQISNLIFDGDLVLIQGSRSLQMEKIVEYYTTT